MADTKSLPMLIEQAEALTNQILQTDGELTPELESALALNGLELREKLDSYGYVLDGLKLRKDYALDRLKQWDKIASNCETAIENIKSRMKLALERLDIPEVHGGEYSFRLQANPPSVIVDDEAKVPEEFKSTEVKVITKVDKKAILDALKDGRDVPGAHAERSTRLVTKPSNKSVVKQ